MNKYTGIEGVLYQFIVEYLKDHNAKELLELITDAMEKSNEIRNKNSDISSYPD